MEVHAPVHVPRPAQPLERRSYQADQGGRGQGDHGVEAREQKRLASAQRVEGEVVGHPGQGSAPSVRGRRHAMNLDAGAHFVGRRRGLAGLVAALRREDMALITALGQRFGQVSQVLSGRGVVGPVILIDEENALAAALPDR